MRSALEKLTEYDDKDLEGVCEKYYTHRCKETRIDFQKLAKEAKKVLAKETIESLRKTAKVAVSLSGGVDSMVLVTVLKSLEQEFKFEVIALHINYGNRLVADIEEEVGRQVLS